MMTFGMLCIGIFGVLNRWCAATLVNYILVAIFLLCDVSSVRCIFGVICTFGMLCIGIFGGASLVRLLLCNASLVHCFLALRAIYFWCCVFGAMHCQLHRAGLLPQWRSYFIFNKARRWSQDWKRN